MLNMITLLILRTDCNGVKAEARKLVRNLLQSLRQVVIETRATVEAAEVKISSYISVILKVKRR